MIQVIKAVSIALCFVVCSLLYMALCLDALEWETTNKCTGCTVLPYIDNRFSSLE
jgi:hypothetical protein